MLRRTTVRLTDKVLCKDFPHARLVTLNNPAALNALDLDMATALQRYLVAEPLPNKAGLYIMKGAGGKAFCAGGDVVNITTDNPPGVARGFFYLECQLVYHLCSMARNNIALWDGFVMGAGSGVSVPGKYRVATEKALVVFPEVGIGMVHEGGSWYLPRLPTPGLGLYMALTQHRVKGADLLHTGIATHYVESARLPQLEADLCNIADPAGLEAVLESYRPSAAPPPSASYAPDELAFLKAAFTLTPETTMPAILESVRAAADRSQLAAHAAKVLPGLSPTALVLTLELLKHGAAAESCTESLKADYTMSQRIVTENDFREGVRALLVDKDKNPKWEKARVEEVTGEYLAKYFKPTTADQAVWDPIKPIASVK